MRIDIRDGYAHKAVAKVTCDGFEQRNFTMADTELGVVERYMHNERGALMMDQGKLCPELRNGRVQIIFNEGWSLSRTDEYVQIKNGKVAGIYRKKKGMDPNKYAMAPTEHAQQVALFMWASQNREQYPELQWMFAVPNGGERDVRVAARLKAEGVRSGVSDIFLPAARGQYHGLFIEMKKPKSAGKAAGKESDKQAEFGAHVTEQGYSYVVCFSFAEARDALVEYLDYGL